MRWLKRQALAFFGQGGFQLGQRRAAPGRDHQLAGLVAHDALVSPGVQHLAREALAPKIFAATTAQAQSAAIRSGLAHGVDEGIELSFHGQRW
jgi:hypothetical protein